MLSSFLFYVPINYMFGSLQPSMAILAMGPILSSAPNNIPHVKKVCATLLSHQLLRPQGIRGLCAAVFGDDSLATNDARVEMLEHVAHVLSTVPANMKPHVGRANISCTCVESLLGLFSYYHPPCNGSAIVARASRLHARSRFCYLADAIP
jgi:hypothetical protein